MRTRRGFVRRYERKFAALLPIALVFALAVFARPALAIYGRAQGVLGAELVSFEPPLNPAERGEQANGETIDATISADGRYVVFETTATNLFENDGESETERKQAEPPGTIREGGIFRYDRVTGQLQLVASGNLVESDEGPSPGTVLLRGAANPSVSAEGRYIAFSSAERLIPRRSLDAGGEHEANVQVYVRDMDKAPDEAGAYTLVSSPDGVERPAVFAPPSEAPAGGNPGAEIWPNTSISVSGESADPDIDVIFRTEAESNLMNGKDVATPAHQLFVRDLQSNSTTLLSRNDETGEPVKSPEGASGPVLGPASISADGSTVSWVSTDATEQTHFLRWEHATSVEPYYLWRRWREPGALTRRITGVVDLDDPECTPAMQEEPLPDSPTATGPCYGPLTEPESRKTSIARSAPVLSANGYTVAFLASTGLRPQDLSKPSRLDVFVTSMLPGVSRKAGTSELTLAANGSGGRSLGSIESLALSADGSTIAFTTTRDLFVLPEPAPIGSFSPEPEQSELYVIHLRADTLERAVLSEEGGELDGPVEGEPTLTSDGSTLAFVAGAPNLFRDDFHNHGFRDAFVASLQAPTGTAEEFAGVDSIPAGFVLAGTASPELGVSVKRGRGGEVILLVETPSAGTITARAKGTIVATVKASRKGSKRKPKHKKETAELAHASAKAPAEGTTTVVLRLLPKYAKDLASAGRIKTVVSIDFAPSPAAETLSSEATATFYPAKTKPPPKKKSTRHASRGASARGPA
jgi:WD40-like Beta Propeller Repeat